MAKETPILQTFDGGVLSPLLGGRTDLAKYFNGCSVLENFLPMVQGPLVRRGGSQFIASAKESDDRSWLVRFQVSERIAYMLEFGHRYIRVYTNRGQLVDGGVPVEIATPYSAADLTAPDGTCAIRVAQSADTMYIFHRSYQPRKLLRQTETTFTLETVSLTNGPFDDVNTDESITVTASAQTGSVTLQASAAIFRPGHVSTLFYMEVSDLSEVKPWAVYQTVAVGDQRRVDSRVYQCTATGGGDAEGPPVTGTLTPVHTEGRAWDGDGQSVGNDQRGPIGVEWEFLHAGYGMVRIDSVTSGTQAQATVIGSLPSDFLPTSATVVTEFPIAAISSAELVARVGAPGHPFLQDQSVTITGTRLYNPDPEANRPPLSLDGAYVIRAATANSFDLTVLFPTGYIYDPASNGKATRTVTNPQAPAASWKWAFSLFSDVNGWPEHGAFWRQRLVLVGGRTVAMSVVGDFENFESKFAGEVQTDSAITQRLNARQINRAVWVVESDELVIGTDGDEWIIGPIQASQAVGPANIRAERRTAYGSRSVPPVEVGGRVLFIQASGQRLRDYVFDFNTNNYASNDTTKLATHVLRSGAVDMTYQQEPDSIIWAARADGMLVGCTYDQEPGRSDVYAWHPHPMVNGWVEAVECMPSPDGASDDLWLIVRREINGQTQRYVELLRAPLGDEDAQAEAFYVDCGLTYRGSPATTISGLEHLEGQTVQILADGAAHPDRKVSGGQVSLQYEASIVHVGLHAPCRMATMSIEAGSTSGTAQGKSKRLTNIILRMYRSLGGNVGPAPANMETLNFRRPSQPMGSPPPLFTGDMGPIPWRGGYERDARIWYTNDQPLPVTLLALMPVLGTNDDR